MKDWLCDMANKLDEHLARLEQLHLDDYLRYITDRRRILSTQFLAGLARGAGTAVGFTILGAVIVIVLQRLAEKNLPLIGDFLATIVEIVQRRLE